MAIIQAESFPVMQESCSKMRIRRLAVITILGGATAAILFAQGSGGPPAPPRAPKAAAPVDLTGYWVSLVTEDWRARMTTPPREISNLYL